MGTIETIIMVVVAFSFTASIGFNTAVSAVAPRGFNLIRTTEVLAHGAAPHCGINIMFNQVVRTEV